VVLTASARATLSQPLRGYGCSQEGLWRHSVWTATAARLLEARVRPALAEQAFVAGLLHDVGKIVIAANHGEQFVSICRKVEREGKSFAEAEAEVLGCSHAEIGGVLAQQWRLPESLAEAVTYHHAPAAAEVDVALAAAVQVADALVLSLGVGAVPEVRAREISESALPLARVPAAVLLSVREEVPQSAAELERLVEE
jgi:putative nucleotidyltransferase with HDIG domain